MGRTRIKQASWRQTRRDRVGRRLPNLIWKDPVKSARWCQQSLVIRAFVFVFPYGSRDAASVVAETAIATIDHSDIRGSEPHGHDPSGAASD